MTAEKFLIRLEAVRSCAGGGKWSARCPGHADKSPSLSISEGERGILVKCWAGCTVAEICAALGLTVGDLFFDSGRANPRAQRPAPKAPRVDRIAVAFRYELAAVDLRLRAEKVLASVTELNIAAWSDQDRDAAMNAVARAYDDLDRAQLFETVADDLRVIEFNSHKGAKYAA